MTEYVKIEKIVPRFPPPAFGDIAKASNDVCLAAASKLQGDAIADLRPPAHQQGLLPHCRRWDAPIGPLAQPLTYPSCPRGQAQGSQWRQLHRQGHLASQRPRHLFRKYLRVLYGEEHETNYVCNSSRERRPFPTVQHPSPLLSIALVFSYPSLRRDSCRRTSFT
jgi:hypothetical protein